jgi:hypothetical protein
MTERLLRFLTAARGRGFAYGQWDCCLFCAEWVLASGGVDPAAEYRGRLRKSKRGAYALMRRVSGGDVDAAWTRACGAPMPNPLFARAGDICMVETDQGRTLGICVGAQIAHLAPEGLAFLPITAAEKAWPL